MKAILIAKENGEAKFNLNFSAEEFEQAQIEAYKKEKDNYVVDGFRKGKAPRSIIEKKYGETVFFDKAMNTLFDKHLAEAYDELELEVIDYPRIEITKAEKGADLESVISVAIFPEVEVKDYKGVEVQEIAESVSQEDIDGTIAEMQKRNARMIDAQRPVKDGDHIVLDYKGFVGDEQFEGGTAENYPLVIGSGSFIPGFEEQLVGANKEEEVEVKVTFPEEYHAENLAGKEAIFKCTVHEIKEEELPELDDEFAKDVSEFDTIDELKADVKAKLEEAKSKANENQMKDKAIEKVYEANDFDIPSVMIEDETNSMIREMGMQLQQQGIQLEQYLQIMGKEIKDLAEDLKEDATRRVKTRIILKGIANTEKLSVSDEEIQEEIQKMADMYKMEKEKLIDLLGKENLSKFGKDMLMNKAIDYIFSNAKIVK